SELVSSGQLAEPIDAGGDLGARFFVEPLRSGELGSERGELLLRALAGLAVGDLGGDLPVAICPFGQGGVDLGALIADRGGVGPREGERAELFEVRAELSVGHALKALDRFEQSQSFLASRRRRRFFGSRRRAIDEGGRSEDRARALLELRGF